MQENLEKKIVGMASEPLIKETNRNLVSKILEIQEELTAMINKKTGELTKSQDEMLLGLSNRLNNTNANL